jgi:hypothetical protein
MEEACFVFSERKISERQIMNGLQSGKIVVRMVNSYSRPEIKLNFLTFNSLVILQHYKKFIALMPRATIQNGAFERVYEKPASRKGQ